MKHPEVAKLMAELYFSTDAAKAILIRVGFPAHLLPESANADSFWSTAVLQLEQGLGETDSITQLIAETASTFKGNTDAQAMHAKWSGAEPAAASSPPKSVTADEPCTTLTLTGVDLPNEFLQTIRDQLGSDTADLLYVSKQQCSIAIPDAGANAGRLQQQIQEIMQTYAPDAPIHVVYQKYNFRPYLYSELTVFGPDTTPYLLQSVPATMTPGDISAAIVAQGRATNERRGRISTVIDAETETGSHRMDPEKTLHENNVKDKSKIRVGTEAIAGNISPELRMEAQLRMRAQIRRFALGHPSFEIVDYDNEDLPNRLTFEFTGPGLAPPENLKDFLAGTENLTTADYRALPWDQLKPVRIDSHRATMHLSAMFPVVAPFVIWNTPVFHPNIWRLPQPGIRPGQVCLGPLMDGYRPDLDFGYLSQLLIDIATYINYEVVDTNTYPDPPAALWARTPSGQALIQSIGGPPMRPTTKREDEEQDPPPLWLRPLADRQAGDWQ